MRIPLLFFATLLFVCCQSESQNDTASYSTPGGYEDEIDVEPPQTMEPPSVPIIEEAPDQGSSQDGSTHGLKLIKEGDMSFDVDDLRTAKSIVDSLLTGLGGYYENEQFHALGYRHTISLKIRLPFDQFDDLILGLESGTGKLTSKSIRVDDVTEEYMDLGIRLKNNLAYLGQYNLILKKANSIKDILEVQEKIRRIESEIDRHKGRMKYLNQRSAFSTLNLELRQIVINDGPHRPSYLKRGWNALTNGGTLFLDALIALISIWPFILGLVLIVIFRRSLFKGWARRKKR